MSRDTPYLRHWRQFGVVPGLRLRRVQVRALTSIDLAEIRDRFGITPAMLDALLTLAADDNDQRDVRIDFEAETVSAVES
jgi:hypothetical protein